MTEKELGYQFAMAVKSNSSLALKSNIVQANGDAAKAREVACSYGAEIVPVIDVKDWAVNMTTQPGEFVYDPDKTHVYMYTGKDAMTHTNPLFFPGSVGVFYWGIVPEIHEGYKVYPNVSGIIVAVRKNDIWWDVTKAKKYRWDAVDNNACIWAPGTAGVHQWIEVTE